MLTDNLFADEMNVGGPDSGKALGVAGPVAAEPRGGHVVGECVKPYVHHVTGIVGHWNAPAERRTADAQVLQTGFEERHHLVAANRGRHEIRMTAKMIEQRLFESRQLEEVAFLRYSLDDVAANRTAAIDQLRFRNKDFVDGAVPAFVLAFVDE